MKRLIFKFLFICIILSHSFSQIISYSITKEKYIYYEEIVYNFNELSKELQGELIGKDKFVFYKLGSPFSEHYLSVKNDDNYFLHTITVNDKNGDLFHVLIDDLERTGVDKDLHKSINGVWIPAYYFDVLKAGNKKKLLSYESFWETDWKTSIGEQWEDEYFPLHLIISDNYFYISSYATGYRFYLITSDISNNGIQCYTLEKNIDTGRIDSKKEILRYFDGENETAIFFERDGDYLNLYNDSNRNEMIESFVFVSNYDFIKENIKMILKGNKCDLSKVTWPRHADGSCDYDGSKKTAAVQTAKTTPSTNVAKNKTMTVSENLKLRSGEATSTQVLTVMQAGTKVKILELGKAETIDGISSNWVKVEVQSVAKDRDGRTIRAGTIGWCYGGYLK